MIPIMAGLTGLRVVQNIMRITKWYNQSKSAQAISSFPFGYLYAGGTVMGYNDFSSLYNKDFKYVGRPQYKSYL